MIAGAVAATGTDDLTLQMVVTGLPAEAFTDVEGVSLLNETDAGFEIETPRYRALTLILADWAEAGASFLDIAGNDPILITTLSEATTAGGVLASLPRRGYGDSRHLFLVSVPDLAETLRGLPARELRLEHIHDY